MPENIIAKTCSIEEFWLLTILQSLEKPLANDDVRTYFTTTTVVRRVSVGFSSFHRYPRNGGDDLHTGRRTEPEPDDDDDPGGSSVVI